MMPIMKTTWSRVAAGAAWALTVLAGSTVVWFVISQAGAQLGAERPQALPVAPSSATPGGAATIDLPSAPMTASASPQPGAHVTATPSPLANAPRELWSSAAGRVVASCVGGVPQATASPEGGWSVTVEREGAAVAVEFKSASGDEVTVNATCSATGSPVISRES